MRKNDLSRRSFLRLSGASTAAVVLGTVGADSAIATATKGKNATVTGRVFVDNGGRGKSLAGVLVSDGLNIAVTDQRGEYTLPIDPSRRLTDMVFVSLPDGYEVPVDPASRTPQFFTRIDQLIKGETRRFELAVSKRQGGQKPTGEFIHLTDVHVNRGSELASNRERFRAQVAQLNALSERPDFILLSGDLMDAGTVEEFNAYQDAVKDSIDTVFSSVGNHDVSGGPNNDYAEDIENFRHYQGPEWYSFEWRGHHVVVIDNYDAGDLSPNGEPESTRNEQQFNWLKADLQHIDKSRPLIVVAHIALNDPLTIPGTDRYIKLLRKYNVKLVLSGHTHRNDVDPNVFPGALTVVTEPAWSPQDGGPVGFRRISLQQDGSFSIPFKQFDVDRRVVVAHPADGSTVPVGKVPLHVSAYDTSSEVKKIAVLLDGRRWGDLEQQRRLDLGRRQPRPRRRRRAPPRRPRDGRCRPRVDDLDDVHGQEEGAGPGAGRGQRLAELRRRHEPRRQGRGGGRPAAEPRVDLPQRRRCDPQQLARRRRRHRVHRPQGRERRRPTTASSRSTCGPAASSGACRPTPRSTGRRASSTGACTSARSAEPCTRSTPSAARSCGNGATASTPPTTSSAGGPTPARSRRMASSTRASGTRSSRSMRSPASSAGRSTAAAPTATTACRR